MMKSRLMVLGLLASFAAMPVFAEDAVPTSRADQVIDRDVKQQTRIESGLQSGQLTTGEAARLEKGESKIDAMESAAMKNGTVSGKEQAAINKAQNAESAAINRLDDNSRVGNPNSASSQRMQADVQHNINQEKRIDQGVENGSLTNREAGKLEKGQAHADRAEYRAGRDGHVGKAEQGHIAKVEGKDSAKIWHKKHNGHKRHEAVQQ